MQDLHSPSAPCGPSLSACNKALATRPLANTHARYWDPTLGLTRPPAEGEAARVKAGLPPGTAHWARFLRPVPLLRSRHTLFRASTLTSCCRSPPV
ncbi:hypothetical protein AAFF_G00310660 [Aldrovandia affinis]|uniref:Uncharacterized protein n=1 Tax=Aldrovandia affinis TaxID=143900 RepID=A0AAD7W0S2_9TELE|nr:hypothetical protein AAFF_G00310660 [Aldrovandia affinis]